MSKFKPDRNNSIIFQWQEKIKVANPNNIFCHCRNCDNECLDSSFDAICDNCDSDNVERISCWQFPDG